MIARRTRNLLVCGAATVLLVGCGGRAEPDSTAVAQAVAATLTAMPPATAQGMTEPQPSATLALAVTEIPTSTSTGTSEPTEAPSATDAPPTATATSAPPTATNVPPTPTSAPSTATPTATPAPQAVQNGNLRAGPGTNYAVIGGVRAGQGLDLTGQNEAGDWYALRDGDAEAWIAAFLVANAPAGSLPVKQSTAPTITPTPIPPTPAPVAQQPAGPTPTSSSSSLRQIGDEFDANGWRLKVREVHKRKAVYLYDRSYVAFGHFLIVVFDAVNVQSGTDYPYRNLRPWVTDRQAKVYGYSSTASSYAQWQLGGLSSAFRDTNPGNLTRVAMAFDIPDNVGDVYLSTEALIWVYLGNFSSMPSED